MDLLRRIAPVVLLLAVISIALRGLIAMSQQGGVMATRAMAVAFIVCDIAISSSLVILLITRELRAPAWIERRLPASGRWLWHVLLGLTVLGYAALAPTFLFFLVQMKK
jgi:hypothetical protein